MPKIILAAIVAVAAALSGCATPQDARNKGPVATYRSDKTPTTVANCIASAWESGYGITNSVNVRPISNGLTLSVSANGNTMVLLDVKNDDTTGSVSKYYKGIVWGEWKWDEAVKSCQ